MTQSQPDKNLRSRASFAFVIIFDVLIVMLVVLYVVAAANGSAAERLKVVILGIVEGVTEFLPISSTGHLIVASDLMQFQNALGGTFEIFIQLGAVVAVALFYRGDLWRQVTTVRQDKGVQNLWLSVIVAFIPAAVVGLLLKDWIKETLFNPITVALSLIVGGIVFLVVERRPALATQQTKTLETISPRQALGIGMAQVLALIPGVSRSGSTIIGGLLAGLDRETATRFSFYLTIPVLGLATIVDLVTSLDEISSGQMLDLLVGAVVAGVVAWLSIGWLLRYVSRNNFIPFGYYRIAAGVLMLILAASGIL